jgi:hypothetical protein
MANTKQFVMAKEEVDSVYSLATHADNIFGTKDVRMVLVDGTTISKATYRVLTLTDGSEVFEVVLS